MSNFNQESVLSVHRWTDTLFSFTTTRNPSFRFRNGEFTMIGLKVGEKPLLRAYSVASANYEDRLEFFSIKVPDGPLTSRLQHLKQGDEIIVSRKATGTLVIDNLEDGRNLYLIGTGTGLAPFLSVIKDPETYDRFEKVVLLHGCRRVAELAYGEMRHEDAAAGQGFCRRQSRGARAVRGRKGLCGALIPLGVIPAVPGNVGWICRPGTGLGPKSRSRRHHLFENGCFYRENPTNLCRKL
jgi:ferredoxin-NADP reductase